MLKTGKLDVKMLQSLLEKYGRVDPRVILGPGIGEDAAAVGTDQKVLVIAADPITFATDEIGYYSVVVNANDVAATGAEPKWFTATILIPEQEGNEALVDKVFQQISNACEGLGVSLIGGHTEITYGIDRILVVGQMMGEVHEGGLIRTGGASPGDMVLLSKGVFVEGTSVIAREREKELRAKGVSESMIGRARQFLFDPGLSVVEEARLAVETAEISAMHDITEGGLANGLNEVAMASGVQLEVQEDRIPVFEESRMLCELFGLNPMGVIGSGSLIITARPEEADKVLKKARVKGRAITKIGRVTKKGRPAVTLVGSDGAFPLPYFDKDQIVKIFS